MAEVECNAGEFTYEELLAIARGSYSSDYITAIEEKEDGGFELFRAASSVMERVSLAIARRFCCSFVIHAHGGAKATGEVEFYRDAATAGVMTVKTGSIVRTANRKEFVTLEDAVFGALDLGPVTVAVEAIATGYEWNVAGEATSAAGEVLEGDIDAIAHAVYDDGSGVGIDLEMQVRNPLPTAGGMDACLDALGEELRVPRVSFETDAAYRVRIQNTPDSVSPAAICRGIDSILSQVGGTCVLREIGTAQFMGFFHDAGSSLDSPQEPVTHFAHDFDFDVVPEDAFKLNMSFAEMRGFFLVGVPRFAETIYSGLVHDETGVNVLNAHDTTSLTAPYGGHDGFDAFESAIYGAVWDTIRAKVAAGVGFDLYTYNT